MKPATGFLFLPKWRVVVCEACECCLHPSNSRRMSHLVTSHGLDYDLAQSLIASMNEHCDNWMTLEECPSSLYGLPMPGIKVQDGLKCLLCPNDHHLTTSETSMVNHLRHDHGKLLRNHSPEHSSLWSECKVQRFFPETFNVKLSIILPTKAKKGSGSQHDAQIRIPVQDPSKPSAVSQPQLYDGFDGFKCLKCTDVVFGTIRLDSVHQHLQGVHGISRESQKSSLVPLWSPCRLSASLGSSMRYNIVAQDSTPRHHVKSQDDAFDSSVVTRDYDGFVCLKCTTDRYCSIIFGHLRSHLRTVHQLKAETQTGQSGPLWSECKVKKNLDQHTSPRLFVEAHSKGEGPSRNQSGTQKPIVLPAKVAKLSAAPHAEVYDGFRCLKCLGTPFASTEYGRVRQHLRRKHGVKAPVGWSACKVMKDPHASQRQYVVASQPVVVQRVQARKATTDPFPFPDWTFPPPADAATEVVDGFQCLKCIEHPYASVNFDRLRGHAHSVHGLKIDDRERAKGSLWSDYQVKNNPDKCKELGRSYVLVQQEVKEQHDDHSKPESAQTQDSPKPPSPAPGPVYTIHHGFQCLKCTETDLLTTDFEQMRRHLREDHGLTLAQLRSSSEPLWSERKFSVLSSDPHPIREAAGPSAGPSQAEHFPSRAASEDSVQFLGVFIATGDKRPLEETLPSRAASEDPDEPSGDSSHLEDSLQLGDSSHLEDDSSQSVEENLATADPDETLQPSAEQQGGEEAEVTRAASEESLQPFAGEEHVRDETFIERALSEEPADSWQPSTPSEEDPTSKATTPPATTSKEEDEPMASAPYEEPLESLPSRAVSEDPYETPDELTLSDEERLETQTRPSHSASEAPHEALEGVLRSIDERLQRDAVPFRAGSENLPESKGDIPLSSEADEPLGDLSQLSASAGVPVLDRHKDAAFYDFSFDDDEEDRIARSPSRPSKRARLIPRASSSASSSQGTIRARLGRDAASPGPSSAVLDSKTDPSNIPRSMLARSETPEFTLLSVRHGPVPEVSQTPEALRETRTLKKEKQKYHEMFRDFCNHFGLSKQQACDILVHFDGRIEKAWDSIDHWCVSMSRTYGVDSIAALEHVNAANGNLQAAESSIELSQRFTKVHSDGRIGSRRWRLSEKVQL